VIKRAAICSDDAGMNVASLLALIRAADAVRCSRREQRGGGGCGGFDTTIFLARFDLMDRGVWPVAGWYGDIRLKD
jgi:hypothetical protein